MKLQIVLVVLAVMVLSCSAEKVKGRRSNISIEQLLRNQRDQEEVDVKPEINNGKLIRLLKADSSKGRFFNKKGNTAPAAPTYLIIAPSYTSTGTGNIPQTQTSTVIETGTQTGTLTLAPAYRAGGDDDDDDFVDEEDNVDDEQITTKTRKQKNNPKLKKVKGKKQNLKFAVPARYMPNFENSAPVRNTGTYKNGVNKLKMLRLNGNGNLKRTDDIIRLVPQQ